LGGGGYLTLLYTFRVVRTMLYIVT